MAKKMELKVSMHCQKCKTQVLKAVTKLTGVDEVSVDLEKGMLVVIGDVDPVRVATCVRKAGKTVEIVRVGPSKEKKPDHCDYQLACPLPPNYFRDYVVFGYPQPCDGGGCNIL